METYNELDSLEMDYGEREDLKYEGWKIYSSAKTTAEKAEGLEMVIKGHFARSKDGYRGKHPGFNLFAQHWLNANGHRYNQDAIALLIEKYGKVTGEPCIERGMSYWVENWRSDPVNPDNVQWQLQ